MRQLFAAGVGALSIAAMMWGNRYTAADWNIFLKGCFVGGVTISILLGLGRRATTATP
jgi:hypothetical protein